MQPNSKATTEIWRPVSSPYEMYEVSNAGRVRRGTRILKPLTSRGGYLRVCLSKHCVLRYASIASLVATAFIGERPSGLTINHIDGVKTNNAVANLEYLSQADNGRHAREVLGHIGAYRGPRPLGYRTNNKLIEPQVRVIKYLLQFSDMWPREIAAIFSVSADTIWEIRKGRVWRTVDCPRLTRELV